MKRLMILALLMSLVVASLAFAQDSAETTVSLGGNEELGSFLVGAEGFTLYIFTNDELGVSNCAGDCAANWPPLTVGENEIPTLDARASGQLGTITREDGSFQVVYNGQPLYYWVNDAQAGDTTGQGVGEVWFVASLPKVGIGGNSDLGEFLVGDKGMTLYTFSNDEAGVSNCAGDCAVNWPPLTVESADDLTVQAGLVGEVSVIEREDGSLQAAYNGMPLYYWVNDAQIGDATGQGVGEVWFVAKTPTLAVATSDLGDILVGGNGMTLYTFNNDEAGVSNCVDACAANWPPLTVAEEIVAGDGVSGELATLERADGSLQVTYNGSPLYYWVKDVQAGDTTGHEVGDVWFVALP